MGLRRPDEERFFPRYVQVETSRFSGRLTKADDGTELSVQVIDVGRDGIGMIVETPLPAGLAIELSLADKKVGMLLVYCMQDLINPERYRCGLRRRGTQENLINLFAAAGCLAKTDS